MRGSAVAVVLALVAGFLAAGCQPAPAPYTESSLRPLDAYEIQRTLIGNSLYRQGRELLRSWEYVSVFRKDSTMTGRVWWSGGEEVVEGIWEVTGDDLYCRTWRNHWGGGKRGCFRVSRDGDTLVFDHVSGSRGDADRYTYRLLSGNPYGL